MVATHGKGRGKHVLRPPLKEGRKFFVRLFPLRAIGHGGAFRFFQHAYKVTFAFEFVRIKAAAHAVDAGDYAGNAAQRRYRREGKFRVFRQKSFHGAFVFLRIEGAGGINYPAAGRGEARRAVQDLPVAPRAHGAVFFAPLFHGYLPPAEHALARAGHVRYHRVEHGAPFVRQDGGAFAGNGAVFHAAALHVLREYPGARGDYLVGNEKLRRKAGGVRALAAGRGAQIQHLFSRLYPRRRHHRHGGRLLDIISARLVQRGLAGSARIIRARPAPRHALKAALGQGGGFQSVEAQRKRRRLFVRSGKVFVFLSQQRAHAREKFFRQVHTDIITRTPAFCNPRARAERLTYFARGFIMVLSIYMGGI